MCFFGAPIRPLGGELPKDLPSTKEAIAKHLAGSPGAEPNETEHGLV